MKMQAILSCRYLHNIISDFYETSHTLNGNNLFIRDRTKRVHNDSLYSCEEIFPYSICQIWLRQLFQAILCQMLDYRISD